MDSNHLVGVGDEGFFCDGPESPDWIDNCGEGVDTVNRYQRNRVLELVEDQRVE